MEATVRFGIVLPAGNTTVETEFPSALQACATAHFQRFTRLASTPEQVRPSADAALEAARVLRPARLSALAIAYTTGSYFGPHDYDDALPRQISEECGILTTTAGLAIVDALRAIQAKRVAVVSPYSSLVNDYCRAYLIGHGFEPVAVAGSVPLGPAGEVPINDIRQMVHEVPKVGADAVLISCTGLRTLSLIAALESEIGMPVVSSNQAMLWRLLSLAGLAPTLPELGGLLGDPIGTSRL